MIWILMNHVVMNCSYMMLMIIKILHGEFSMPTNTMVWSSHIKACIQFFNFPNDQLVIMFLLHDKNMFFPYMYMWWSRFWRGSWFMRWSKLSWIKSLYINWLITLSSMCRSACVRADHFAWCKRQNGVMGQRIDQQGLRTEDEHDARSWTQCHASWKFRKRRNRWLSCRRVTEPSWRWTRKASARSKCWRVL